MGPLARDLDISFPHLCLWSLFLLNHYSIPLNFCPVEDLVLKWSADVNIESPYVNIESLHKSCCLSLKMLLVLASAFTHIGKGEVGPKIVGYC